MLTRLTQQSSTGLPLRIGIATYSLRMVPTDQAIAVCKRLGIETCSIKDVHLPRKSTAAERKAGYQKWMDAGITPLSAGNIALPDNEDAIRDAFVYCKEIGVPTMVCTPEIASLPLLDRLSQEYAINIAIHNHGPEDKKFGDPDIVMGHVGKMNPRMGLCVDIGHAARNGKNPADQIRKYRDRVYDVHFKDVKAGAKGLAVGSAIASIGLTAAKVTPIITGRRMPNHCVAPSDWISVTMPQTNRSAEIRKATSAGSSFSARPTISGTAMAPAYITSTCCRPSVNRRFRP